MYNESDFIARQRCVEEWLTEAAHERLLTTAAHEQRLRTTQHAAERAGIRVALLMWTSRLLVRAGQRLEIVANSDQSVITP